MAEHQPMLINYAASLCSESFTVTLAPATKNGKPFLMLKVELNYSWNSPAKNWAYGYYDYSTGTQFPAVWTGTSSPWSHMFYSGEVPVGIQGIEQSSNTPKFCANCGQSLKPGAKFCAQCGTSIVVSASSSTSRLNNFEIEYSDFTLDIPLGKPLGATLAELVVSLIFDEYSPKERSLLLAFLSEEFSTAQVKSLINGNKSSSKCPINLAEAQKLQSLVQQGAQLTTIQTKYAELLLREAPISFGYWGAIKALLKFQPEKVSKQAIGAGFARIAALGKPETSWWAKREQIEDLRILDELAQVPLASTRYYLSRFGRRKLVELSLRKPADYIDLATGFLIAADRSSSTIDFMFAHIIYGAHNYLSRSSRSVRSDLNNLEIAPFEPQLWNKSKSELCQIWSGIVRSREIQDFVFTVAAKHKIALPPLEGKAINLALGSQIAELRAQVISQLARDPQSWDSLTDSAWGTFLREIDLEQLAKLKNSLTQFESPYSLLSGLERIIEDLTDPKDQRLQLLSAIYFTLEPEYQQWGRNAEFEGKAAAALLLSGNSVDLEHFDLLNERLGLDALVACWAFMQEHNVVDNNRKTTFIDSALRYWEKQNLIARKYTIEKISKSAPGLYVELCSTLIPANYDFELIKAFILNLDCLDASSQLATDAIANLLNYVPTTDIAPTLDEVFELEKLAASVSMRELLNSSPVTRMLAWEQLSKRPLTALSEELVSDKPLLTSTLFELRKRNIANASGQQVEILLQFIGSSKIQADISPELLVGATTNPNSELATLGQKVLKKRGIFSEHWLEIAETQLPLAIRFAREYLLSLNKEELSPSLLLALDSPVIAVRDMALELLDTLRGKIDIPFVYRRLSESRDPVIRGRVAEEALLAPWSDGKDLVAFDSEMLVTLRRTRNAREHVMARFEEESSQSSESSFVTSERLQALISLTRIGNSRDKEWALARLAQLKNAGLDIEGVSLTFVTGGQTHV